MGNSKLFLNKLTTQLWKYSGDDEEMVERLAMLTIVVLTGTLTFFVMSLSLFFIKTAPLILLYVDGFGFFTCALMPLFYRWSRQSYTFIISIVLADAIMIFTVMCYMTGGINSPGTIWFILTPAISGLMMGSKGVFSGCLATLCSVTLLYFISIHNGATGIPTEMMVVRLRSVVVSTIVLSVIIYISQNNIKQKIQKLKISRDNAGKLLAILSDDIQNQVNMLKTSAGILDNSVLMCKDDGGCNECAFNKQTTRINKAINLIDDIISKTNITHVGRDNSNSSLELSSVKILDAVNNAIFMMTDNLNSKNITITVQNELPENTMVKADQTSLTSQVLSNILSNSIKFSNPDDNIIIKLYSGRNEHSIAINVTDFGIGIPSEILKNIFSTTKRTNRIGTSGEKGTGFGMPLVKKYIEYYGGNIQISSKTADMFPSGHGTIMEITLNRILPVAIDNIKKVA